MRRKSDKFQFRMTMLLMALNAALSIFASVIGYKAIRAMDVFYSFVSSVADSMKDSKRGLLPEGY